MRKGVDLKEGTKVYVSPNSNVEFKAADNISLEIKPGELLMLLAPYIL